jgi:hypothetical protein
MALPSTSGCLGTSDLRPSWDQHASGGSARLFVAMQDIWVSLHSIRWRSTFFYGFIVDNFNHHRRTLHATCLFKILLSISGCLGSSWFETFLRSACLGWLCQTLCSYAGRSRCLYTSFDQHDLVFLLFLSIKLAMMPTLMLGGYSTRASLTPSCFLRHIDLLGNLFLKKSLLNLIFSSFFFGSSYRSSCLLRCLDTTLWVCPWCPLNFFIVVSIYWKYASYMSSLDLTSFGKTTNRSADKLICSFFFWPTCMLFDLSITLQLRHDLSKVVAPTPRSGTCETWVPLGPVTPWNFQFQDVNRENN